MDGPTMSDPTLRNLFLGFMTETWMEKAEKRAREGKLKLRVTKKRWTNRGLYKGGGLFIYWAMERRGASDHCTPFERHQEALRAEAIANGKDPGRVTSQEVSLDLIWRHGAAGKALQLTS